MTFRPIGVLLAFCLLVPAAGGAGHRPAAGMSTAASSGTLRVVLPTLGASAFSSPAPGALDPQFPQFYDSLELFRCCLTRTLLSYSGRSTEQGGAVLRPDLAARLPDVSSDGRTWTFHLRRGISYAPPLQDVKVTSRDFVRALERGARLARLAFGTVNAVLNPTYPLIEGYTAFGRGRAGSIAGLETPDDHTLVIHLTEPSGDLAARLALPDASPIPPLPSEPAARDGAATGHDGTYGRFLVATGPYMIAGSERLDFRKPPGRQLPVAGFRPRKSLLLVRNPSWRTATDPLRPAYSDRISIRLGGTAEQAVAAVRQGRADIVLDPGPPPHVPSADIARYRAKPSLGRVEIHFRDFIRYLSLNLAVPPFDDLHVRRAMNYVIDKGEAIRRQGGPIVGQPAGHIAMDSLFDNALVGYDPYRTASRAERISRAREEMARSRYDRNRDGRCDAAVCHRVLGLSLIGFQGIVTSVAHDLAAIGITLRVRTPKVPQQVFAALSDPRKHIPLGVNVGYGKDDLNGAGLLPALFAGSGLGINNYSLVGAKPAQLRRWGYSVQKVPSVDDRIRECVALVAGPQTQCWASLDQYLMERVVPWVPLVFESHVDLVPARVARYSFDQLAALPALDRIALRGEP
jgi:peptide/nickel transport system substrate-binding protein